MNLIDAKKNIVLIGMPGAGKSTVGVLLAKEFSTTFLDTDISIQAREGRRIKDIIAKKGIEAFLKIEEDYLLSLEPSGEIISTGGSAIYSEKGMGYLRSIGVIVYLEVDLPEIEKRFSNMDERGVVREPGQSMLDLFRERTPLYRKYADITIDCRELSLFDIVKDIAKKLHGRL